MAFHLLGYVLLFFVAAGGVHWLLYKPVVRWPCADQHSMMNCFHANSYCAWCASTRRCVEWNPCRNETYEPPALECPAKNDNVQWQVFPTRDSWRTCAFIDESVQRVAVWVIGLFGCCMMALVCLGVIVHCMEEEHRRGHTQDTLPLTAIKSV